VAAVGRGIRPGPRVKVAGQSRVRPVLEFKMADERVAAAASWFILGCLDRVWRPERTSPPTRQFLRSTACAARPSSSRERARTARQGCGAAGTQMVTDPDHPVGKVDPYGRRGRRAPSRELESTAARRCSKTTDAARQGIRKEVVASATLAELKSRRPSRLSPSRNGWRTTLGAAWLHLVDLDELTSPHPGFDKRDRRPAGDLDGPPTSSSPTSPPTALLVVDVDLMRSATRIGRQSPIPVVTQSLQRLAYELNPLLRRRFRPR